MQRETSQTSSGRPWGSLGALVGWVGARGGVLSALALSAHVALVLRFLPLRTVLSSDPILETDYAHHYDSVATTVAAWSGSGRHWAYDPSFCAGYPAGTLFDVDVKLLEVVSFGLSRLGVPVPTAFNLLILGFFLGAPLLLLAACRVSGGSWGVTALVTGSGVLLWHGDPMLVNYNAQGMCSFIFAVYWALFTASILERYLREGGAGLWAALTVAVAVGMHVHILYPFVLFAPALALYAQALRGLPARRHALLAAALVLALAANAWWIATLIRFYPYRTLTRYGAPARWSDLGAVLAQLRSRPILLALAGASGLWLARARYRAVAWAGLASLAWFFFLSDLSARVPVISTLEPERFRVALAVFAAVGVCLGLSAAMDHDRVRRLPSLVAIPAGLAGLALAGWLPLPYGPRLQRFRSGREDYAPLVAWIEQSTSRDARVALMDRSPGFFSPTRLKHYVARDFIGGPFSQMNMLHNYANFNRVRFFQKHIGELTALDVAGYAETYNIRWILGGSDESCAKLASFPEVLESAARFDLVERARDVAWGIFAREAHHPVCAFVVRQASTYFLQGSGTVEAGLNRIAVHGASPGGVALKLHWMGSLATDPPLPIRRREVKGSPIGFIEVDNGDTADFVITNTYR
jgi:hypothetical protein